jgi:hypothetical protein
MTADEDAGCSRTNAGEGAIEVAMELIWLEPNG